MSQTVESPFTQALQVETYYSGLGDNVRVYKDASGQVYLSLAPLPILIFIAIFSALVVISMMLNFLRSKSSVAQAFQPAQPAPPAPLLTTSFPRSKVRRLTL